MLLLAALANLPVINAQLSDLPDLSTATQTTAASSSTAASSTKASSTPSSTAASTTAASSTAASTTQTSATATFTASGTSSSVAGLTDLPTIAGVGVPTLVIPYTASAPFMQKSNLPEGTVFIAVGAVLAFLGFCVLAWRGLVAWSINRSVKRAAMASITASDIKSGWMGGASNTGKHGGLYNSNEGSSLSLDALTSSGKPLSSARKSQLRDNRTVSNAQSLFFSPTAQTSTTPMAGVGPNNRSSSYLPAGYYASPSAAPAGGRQSTTLNALTPDHAQSRLSRNMNGSPPVSPSRQNHSRDGLRAPSRDGASRLSGYGGYGSARNSTLVPPGSSHGGASTLSAQHSNSSLMVGTGVEDSTLPGSRAPSAYFEDILEHHGNGPRERF
ncbi:hypothetical protein H2203_004217 [Taxawa tesnikishii (nom. ined.)]|nr:hypothetical protein H2203_004217 [Dothideales sp. JES 119]